MVASVARRFGAQRDCVRRCRKAQDGRGVAAGRPAAMAQSPSTVEKALTGLVGNSMIASDIAAFVSGPLLTCYPPKLAKMVRSGELQFIHVLDPEVAFSDYNLRSGAYHVFGLRDIDDMVELEGMLIRFEYRSPSFIENALIIGVMTGTDLSCDAFPFYIDHWRSFYCSRICNMPTVLWPVPADITGDGEESSIGCCVRGKFYYAMRPCKPPRSWEDASDSD